MPNCPVCKINTNVYLKKKGIKENEYKCTKCGNSFCDESLVKLSMETVKEGAKYGVAKKGGGSGS